MTTYFQPMATGCFKTFCNIDVNKSNVKDYTAVFDIDNEFVFDKNKMLTKGRNTPFDGWKLYGETLFTIMGGKITYEKLC